MRWFYTKDYWLCPLCLGVRKIFGYLSKLIKTLDFIEEEWTLELLLDSFCLREIRAKDAYWLLCLSGPRGSGDLGVVTVAKLLLFLLKNVLGF